ncbi:pentapeptide repeat-containing protein [Ferdinandcohnia sp. Marseille-Q9671]
MSSKIAKKFKDKLQADCENCFGLCCVALPFAKSADFACNKDGGTPCSNLKTDYSCSIHSNLRSKGYRGCTVYECFGAGQKVSKVTFGGKEWRGNQEVAAEMFDVFPIMQQLHEMLYYIHEALQLEQVKPILQELKTIFEETESLTYKSPGELKELHLSAHRASVNELLLRTSELVCNKVKGKNLGRDLIGAKLNRHSLRGSNFRGALLIAADLRDADVRMSDFIGADLRDADLRGANLEGSIFLTQAQINSANGNHKTRLPNGLQFPKHWIE